MIMNVSFLSYLLESDLFFTLQGLDLALNNLCVFRFRLRWTGIIRGETPLMMGMTAGS